jgi:uncharacterized protein (TIGR03545 family)
MTNSSANPQTSANTPNSAKKRRPSGPIRTGAVVPILIIVVLIYAYFALFFDMHLRHGLEYAGTHANGAEVDIASVHTSFWNASLEIKKIEVTDAEAPEKNKLQIGEVRWQMLWDALLRGKVAINDASILDIEIGAPRKNPGRVLPPDPPSESKVEKIRKQALGEAEKEFSGNVFGDIAALLNGADPNAQLQNLQTNLKSDARIKELQADLDVKQKEWQERIAKLPQSKDLQALGDKLKGIKTSGFQNPGELAQSLQQLNGVLQDANSKYSEIKNTSDALNSDVATYQNAFKDLEKLVQQDIKDLEGRLKIPKLDVESISRLLFGPMFLQKVKKAEFYMTKAREYIPPPKTAEQKAQEEQAKLKPHERAKGRNYKFGRPMSYPLFWLKHAAISSHASDADYSGDLKGEIIDLTDDQPALGRPLKLSFKGDFPKQVIKDTEGELIIDHTTASPEEKLTLKVGSFAVNEQILVNSPEAVIGFEKAQGTSTFNCDFKEQNVAITSKVLFQNIDYKVSSKTALLEELLKGTFKDVPKVTLDAGLSGTWSDLKFNIDTNLGRDLQHAFEKQLQAKINEAKAKLNVLVNGRIGDEKSKLMSQYKEIESKIKGELGAKQAEIDKAKGQIDQAKDKATKDQGKQLQDQGQKALDELKKNFHF